MPRHSASRAERLAQRARCRRGVFGYDALATPLRRCNDRKYRPPDRRWHRGSPVNQCYDAAVNNQLDRIDEPPAAVELQPPLVSIVVPAFNEELWIERCVRALQAQRTSVAYEIIVVDNNSSDRTAEVAAALGVRLVSETRRGIVWARQAGEDAARGSIVAHIDADSEAPPNWIEQIAQTFARHPETAVVSGPMCFPKAPLLMQLIAPLQNLGVLLWWLLTRRLAVLNGCNFAVRTALLAEAGGFATNMPTTGDSRVLAILKPYGGARRIGAKMRTSGRRFHGEGTVRVLIFYAKEQLVAALGREKVMTASDIRIPDGWVVEGKRRSKRALMLAPALPIALLAGSCAYLAINPRTQVYGKIVLHGPTDAKVVALTFDDGPNEPYTSEILDVLQQEGVHATFFAVGENVLTYPDAARRIVSDGNVIANHSWDHSRLATAVDLSYSEATKAQDAISQVTGVTPRYFRPPAGIHTPWQLRKVTSMGLTTVNWDAEGYDWQKPNSPERIEEKVFADIHPGAIILLHDGDETHHGSDRSMTVAALPVIIDTLRAEGYQFVTIPQLLGTPAYQQ
jgi:peptidoglycan-N-acetylglucosamine deacetylase